MMPGIAESRRSDAPSDQNAGSRRDRRLATGIAVSLAGKAVGLAAPLIIVPVTFQYLGIERYGLWMAITSLTSMALFADLGLGNGLLTRLARSHAKRDMETAARDIASAYAVLGVLAAALLIVLFAGGRLVSWPAMFNVHDPVLSGEVDLIVYICIGSFIVNVPLSLIQRIQFAHQQVAASSLWQAAGSVLSAGLVGAGVAIGADYELVIAAAVLSVPAVNLVNSLFYFLVRNSDLRPRLSNVSRKSVGGIGRLGLRFCVLSAISSVALNVDGLLAARMLGLEAAAEYSVVARLFGVLSLFIALTGLSLWPASAEALVRSEAAWVRRSTRRMSIISGSVVGIGCAVIVVFGERLLATLLRSGAAGFTSAPLLVAMSLSAVLVAVTSPLFMVQNSVGLLRPQFVGWSLFLLLSLALKFALLQRLGLVAIPASNFLAHVVTLVPAAWIGYQRSLKTTVRIG